MFIPRHPVVENQFCSYAATTSGIGAVGVGGVICYAGSVLYLDSGASNEEAMAKRYTTQAAMDALSADTDPENFPFGFAEQKVKMGYHSVHPTGFVMPGDLGSSDVIAQPYYAVGGDIDGYKSAPLAIAHHGVWDTVHYICEHTTNTVTAGNHMKPGQRLWVAANSHAKVTNHLTGATDDSKDYEPLQDKGNTTLPAVARVVKGASAAKCSANIANTTLFPIRIKLLIQLYKKNELRMD